MQTVHAISALSHWVLSAAFVLSAVFGALVQRTHFCTMGAVSDVVVLQNWIRMRQWGMAVGVSMIGFALLVYTQQIDATKTLYTSNRWQWLSALVGGLLFGMGMVLSSGCGSKTLVRVGTGNLKSLVVMIVMGFAAYATLRGVFAVLRVAVIDPVAVTFPANATLGEGVARLMNWSPATAGLICAALIGTGLIVWALRDKEFLHADNLLVGFGLGFIVTGMWWVSGSLGYVAEHPVTLTETFLTTRSNKIEAMSFVAPVAYLLDWLILFSDDNNVLTFSVVSVFGVVFGSWLNSISNRTFRWEGFGSTEDLANHLVGAVFMGVGGVTALGCTIGQGLSGISTLHATSFVAVAAILGGAVIALKYQQWRLDKLDQ